MRRNGLALLAGLVAAAALACSATLALELRRERDRVDALEAWRSDCLAQGELVWFSPDGPRRVRVR